MVDLSYLRLNQTLLSQLSSLSVAINGGSSFTLSFSIPLSLHLSLSVNSIFFQAPMAMDNTIPLILASVSCSCFILLILIFLMFVCRRRRVIDDHSRRTRNFSDPPSTPPNPTSVTVTESFDPSICEISMAELSVATKSFSSDLVVGDGSFGLVYRAELSNGVVVAVKKLHPDALQGFREFRAEMETLGKLRHPNIVKILGYCISGPDRVLIYEFFEKNSLDYWLHETENAPFSWSTRVSITLDVARGLAYLHGLRKPIIHRDIKSSNVLLDSHFVGHIADFGLARSIDASMSHVSTQVAGTMGYMPPEYWEGNTAATVKADVYSFGVLMLEMATRRRPNWPVVVDEKTEVGLAQWAVMMEGQEGQNRFYEMVDSGCVVGGGDNGVEEYFRIACLCTKESTRERPTMNQVVELLEQLCRLI